MGPWTSISPESLVRPFGTYIPDFTAHIESSTIRILRINIHSDQSYKIPNIEKRMKILNIWHEKSLPATPISTTPRSSTQQKLPTMHQQKQYDNKTMRLDAIHVLDRHDSNEIDLNNTFHSNIRMNNGFIDEGQINITNDVSNSISRIHINDNHDSSIKSGKIEEEKPLLDITLNPLMGRRISPPSVAGLGSALPPVVRGLRSPSSPESIRPLDKSSGDKLTAQKLPVEKLPADKRVYPDKDDSGVIFESKSGNNHL